MNCHGNGDGPAKATKKKISSHSYAWLSPESHLVPEYKLIEKIRTVVFFTGSRPWK